MELGPETGLSEIMSRNFQSIGSGAAKPEQYVSLVNWEAESIQGIKVHDISISDVKTMEAEFWQLCSRWESLAENSKLKLVYK